MPIHFGLFCSTWLSHRTQDALAVGIVQAILLFITMAGLVATACTDPGLMKRYVERPAVGGERWLDRCTMRAHLPVCLICFVCYVRYFHDIAKSYRPSAGNVLFCQHCRVLVQVSQLLRRKTRAEGEVVAVRLCAVYTRVPASLLQHDWMRLCSEIVLLLSFFFLFFLILQEMDHMCPWTGTAIGKGNMPAFKVFTRSITVLFLYQFSVLLYVVWAISYISLNKPGFLPFHNTSKKLPVCTKIILLVCL